MYRYRFSLILLLIFFLGIARINAQISTENKSDQKPAGASQKPDETAPAEEPDAEKSDFAKLLDKELKENTKPLTEQEKISWVWQFTKTMLVLFGLIAFFYVIWKVFIFKRDLPSMAANVFKLWHDFPIKPNKSLQIVEIGNKLLILGISDSGIQLVTEISEKSIIDQIKLDCEKDSQLGRPDFLLELSKAVRSRVKGWVNPEKEIRKTINQSDENEDFWQGARKQSIGKLQKLKNEKDSLR